MVIRGSGPIIQPHTACTDTASQLRREECVICAAPAVDFGCTAAAIVVGARARTRTSAR